MPFPPHRYSLVACARWEADAVAEWLSYHRAIGFDHVFLYCNDDDPDELFDRVAPFGRFVTFLHVPFPGQQFLIYRHFLRHHRHLTEWVMLLDLDEFLFLGPHDTLARYMSGRSNDQDAIYFNWVVFGSSGHRTRPPGSVLRHYTRRAAHPDPHTKCLARASAIRADRLDPFTHHALHHHWPATLLPGRRVNILGEPMDEYWQDFPRAAGRSVSRPEARAAILAGPCIFHYAFKSAADFQRRRDRGVAADFEGQRRWGERDDRGETEALLAQLDEVTDDRLARFSAARARPPSLLDPPVPWPNVALGKPADQSSVSPYSRGHTTRDDAAGAVNGRPTGGHAFHTAEEHRPWWLVDLGADHRIHAVRVFNRLDHALTAARLRDFDLQVAAAGEHWRTLDAVRGDTVWGGIDGEPYEHRPDPPARARYLRVILAGRGFLHLDQVEIFGEPASEES